MRVDEIKNYTQLGEVNYHQRIFTVLYAREKEMQLLCAQENLWRVTAAANVSNERSFVGLNVYK